MGLHAEIVTRVTTAEDPSVHYYESNDFIGRSKTPEAVVKQLVENNKSFGSPCFSIFAALTNFFLAAPLDNRHGLVTLVGVQFQSAPIRAELGWAEARDIPFRNLASVEKLSITFERTL